LLLLLLLLLLWGVLLGLLFGVHDQILAEWRQRQQPHGKHEVV
jgi:hypothetical protein